MVAAAAKTGLGSMAGLATGAGGLAELTLLACGDAGGVPAIFGLTGMRGLGRAAAACSFVCVCKGKQGRFSTQIENERERERERCGIHTVGGVSSICRTKGRDVRGLQCASVYVM